MNTFAIVIIAVMGVLAIWAYFALYYSRIHATPGHQQDFDNGLRFGGDDPNHSNGWTLGDLFGNGSDEVD